MFEKIKNEEPYLDKKWSKNIRSLLANLLEKDSEIRMSNIADIKNHPWFLKINWEQLIRKEIKPHFRPKIEDDIDVQNFDREFTECSLESDISSFEGGRLSGF